MPTYGYQCKSCKFEFSVFQNMKDDAIKICPECKGEVVRLLYPVGIVFKGSGWYINDSRKPEPKSDSEANTAASKSESESKESPSAESTSKKEDSPSTAAAPASESQSSSKTESAAPSPSSKE